MDQHESITKVLDKLSQSGTIIKGTSPKRGALLIKQDGSSEVKWFDNPISATRIENVKQ